MAAMMSRKPPLVGRRFQLGRASSPALIDAVRTVRRWLLARGHYCHARHIMSPSPEEGMAEGSLVRSIPQSASPRAPHLSEPAVASPIHGLLHELGKLHACAV